MRKILIVSSSRAERGLLEPVMVELKKNPDVDAKWFFFESDCPTWEVLEGFNAYLKFFQPDIVVVPCDRFEMVYIAACAFHSGYICVHFHAGNFNTSHPDDFNRRAISLYSHLMLCNMSEHKENLIRQGEESWRINVVGSTAFDIELDDSITPKELFDLVILHPDPVSADATLDDMIKAPSIMKESPASKIVWIYPNHDRNSEIIGFWLHVMETDNAWRKAGLTTYQTVPRAQFLSLLKNCRKAVGNSSSFYYEMPMLDSSPKLIQIGERNKGLIVPKTELGGSRKIADILSTIRIDDNLRRKKMNPCGAE